MNRQRALIIVVGAFYCLVLLSSISMLPKLRWSQGVRDGFSEFPAQPSPGSLRDDLGSPHLATPFAWFMLGNGARFRTPLVLEPPFDPEDGATFRTEDFRVRIAGIEVPGRDAICFNAERQRWACGRQARAALYNIIRNDTLKCQPLLGIHGQQRRDFDALFAQCLLHGTNVGLEMIRLGFARAVGFVSPEEEIARKQKLGLWNGDWSVIR